MLRWGAYGTREGALLKGAADQMWQCRGWLCWEEVEGGGVPFLFGAWHRRGGE